MSLLCNNTSSGNQMYSWSIIQGGIKGLGPLSIQWAEINTYTCMYHVDVDPCGCGKLRPAPNLLKWNRLLIAAHKNSCRQHIFEKHYLEHIIIIPDVKEALYSRSLTD